MKRTVCLIIRDGWGISEKQEHNAVYHAKTPFIDHCKSIYPFSYLKCSGEAVGLPESYQGSSEVGHLNMGAGRIVIQELKRIDDALSDGSLFRSPKWQQFMNSWKERKSALHFMGLLQDEGVHAHQEHLFKLIKRARLEYPEGKIFVHPFSDGRDTPPKSFLGYFSVLENLLQEVGNANVATLMGRYYAMDRSENWALTDRAFDCLLNAKGELVEDLPQYVKRAYQDLKTPDGADMFDEYLPPLVYKGFEGIASTDLVFHSNYRQDRAIQLSKAFSGQFYGGKLKSKEGITYLGFTKYFDEFDNYLMGSMQSSGNMDALLGQVVSEAGLKQLRIAETQKFRHVTSFFNGKRTSALEGEEQVEVPSRFDPASFATHPEMEAFNVTEALLKKMETTHYDLIVVNYANGDMVGHTGDFAAAVKAIEIVDQCLSLLVEKLLEQDAHILITADHGNSEEMYDEALQSAKTSHTLNPVDCIYLAKDAAGKKLADGKLSDIAPTILELLSLPKPKEMSATSLFCKKQKPVSI